MLRANPRSAARVRDGGSIEPGASRPERTASRSASSRSFGYRAPRLDDLAQVEVEIAAAGIGPRSHYWIEPCFGSIRTNLEDMTQTLETQLAANKRLKIYKSSPELLRRHDGPEHRGRQGRRARDRRAHQDPRIADQPLRVLPEHASRRRPQARCQRAELDVLAAWEEAGDLFSERERAALALTEAITEIADGVPDDVYERAAAVFDERELGQVIAMAVTINAWNRINVTVRTAVPRR